MSTEEPGNGGDAQPDLGDTGMPEATPPPPPPPPPPASTPPPPPPSMPATPAASTPSGASSFDPASVPTAVWISAGGALVLLISVFLNWYSGSVKIANISIGGSENGWDSGVLAKLVALLALVALAVWVIELFFPDVTLPAPAWMIAGGAGAISLLFVLIKVIDKPSSGSSAVSVSLSFGIWLALVSAIAVVAGAYLRMNESPS
jgi:hypothetical protein